MTKVSIIIPVYNAEEYLERCLDSVVNQTLEDIEIICVNDCSTDNSIEILNEYAKKDSRIKVIDCKSNGGESKARNIGLDNATGEYLAFVDNDDTVDLNFYEKLYILAKNNNLDIAKGNSNEFDYNNELKNNSYNEIIEKNNNDKFFFVTHWWTAIYKKTLINSNNIRFLENVILGGDIIFLNQVLLKSTSFDVIDDVFYTHHLRKNSGDSEHLSINKINSAIYAYSTIIKNLVNNKLLVSDIGLGYATAYYLGGIYTRFFHNNTTEARQICKQNTIEMYKLVKEIPYFNENFEKLLPEILYLLKKNDLNCLDEITSREPISFIEKLRYRQKLRLMK